MSYRICLPDFQPNCRIGYSAHCGLTPMSDSLTSLRVVSDYKTQIVVSARKSGAQGVTRS
jgi:hypothetical protein